eukprot:SAG22_NODE_6357_length_866_cov_1.342894_2_plen_40_part_01
MASSSFSRMVILTKRANRVWYARQPAPLAAELVELLYSKT